MINANVSVNSSYAQHPPPPSHPLGFCGAFARLVSPAGGVFANFVLPGGICQPRGHSRAFVTHTVSYQNILGFHSREKAEIRMETF